MNIRFGKRWVGLPLILLFCLSGASGQAHILDTVFLVRGEVVHFDFGKYELLPVYDSLLTELGSWYEQQPRIERIVLTGHTDAIGGDRSNQDLSRKRSRAVREKLLSLGIPDSLIQIANYGEALPVGSNETEIGRYYNRRVTLDFYQSGQALAVRGQLVDDRSGFGIAGEIVAISKGRPDSLRTDSSGYFELLVPLKGILSLQGYALRHYFNSLIINPALPLPDSLVKIPLRKIKTGQIIDVENLYYISNTPVLIDRSKPELDKLVLFMRYNPGVSIEIAGHVNVPGKTRVSERSWQYELSLLRAKMVYHYLLSHGISAFRMRYRGYGNWQMRYRNPANAEEAQLNRRVEIRILNDGTLR